MEIEEELAKLQHSFLHESGEAFATKRTKSLIFMKKTFPMFLILLLAMFLEGCKSNALKEQNAAKAIREFVSTHNLRLPELEVSPTTLRTVSEPDVYSETETKVNATFQRGTEPAFTLVFHFTRKPDNHWFLFSIEGEEETSARLQAWLRTFPKLEIQVQ